MVFKYSIKESICLIKLSTTANPIYESLKEKILNNEIHLGEHLKERELAEKYDVSRTIIKSVLNRLASNGLIDLIPYRGATVKRFSHKEFLDFYQVRISLEKLAAELFCLNASKKNMERLKDNIKKSQDALKIMNIKLYRELDIKFHNIIIIGSCNTGLIEISKSYFNKPDIYRSFLFLKGKAQISFDDHNNLYNAIKLKDSAKSGEIMEEHVKRSLNYFGEYMEIQKILEP